MGKKKTKIKSIQKLQRIENRDKLENEKKLKEKEKKKKEDKKVRLKKVFVKSVSVLVCFAFCFVLFLGVGLVINAKRKQVDKLFNCGVVPVEYENSWGYINSSGKKIIDFKFEHAFGFTKNKLALVGYNGKFGFINKKGEFVIDPIYEKAVSFSGDVAICKLNENYGTIDKNGNTVTDFIYSNILEYNGDYAVAVKDEKFGIINKKGEVIVDFAYEKIDSVNSCYFKYYADGLIYLGFIDNSKTEDKVFTDNFQDLTLLDNGYCIYKRKGLYGLFDDNKNIVLENKFTDLKYESGEYLTYSTNGDFHGYLDFKGNIFIRERYLVASSFNNGYAVVRYMGDETYFVLNKKGKTVFSGVYDYLEPYHNNRAIFKQNSLFGVITPKGKVMQEAKYKYLSSFYDDGYAIFMNSDNLYGIMRTDGSIRVEAKYTNIAYSA